MDYTNLNKINITLWIPSPTKSLYKVLNRTYKYLDVCHLTIFNIVEKYSSPRLFFDLIKKVTFS